MIEDWRIRGAVASAFLFSLTVFATGAITHSIGQAFGSLPWFAGPIFHLLFFAILPITGLFSDIREMLVRGMIFTAMVAFFSIYFFHDVSEFVVALLAFLLALIIAYRKRET